MSKETCRFTKCSMPRSKYLQIQACARERSSEHTVVSNQVFLRFSSISPDILRESSTYDSHVRFRRVLNFSKFIHVLILAALTIRILRRLLVATLYSCIMPPFQGVASCRRLLRCLPPKLTSLELVLVRERFNSVGNWLRSLVFGNMLLHHCSKRIQGCIALEEHGPFAGQVQAHSPALDADLRIHSSGDS